MTKRMFNVTAQWDAEAQVFYSVSDIVGLHIEAATIEEFETILMDVAPGLLVANHMSKDELANSAPEDLIPAILWQRPSGKAA
jgi:cobalamin biosynthesis protein CbiD